MKARISALPLLIGGSLLLGAPGFARDDKAVPEHQLSEFTLGSHLSGAKVDLASLQGKAVAIEYWGTR